MTDLNNTNANQTALQLEIAKFEQQRSEKSFSGRNKALGKMVNCGVCDRRHRQSEVCTQRMLVEIANSRFSIVGKKQFKGRRRNPHFSIAKLRLVDLTKQLFPVHHHYIGDPMNAMRAARLEAERILTEKRRDKRRVHQHIQHTSRRINRGLLSPGSR